MMTKLIDHFVKVAMAVREQTIKKALDVALSRGHDFAYVSLDVEFERDTDIRAGNNVGVSYQYFTSDHDFNRQGFSQHKTTEAPV